MPIRLDYEVGHEPPDLTTALGPEGRDFELALWFSSAEHFAAMVMQQPALIDSIVGPHVEIDSVKFIAGADGDPVENDRLGLCVAGRACG